MAGRFNLATAKDAKLAKIHKDFRWYILGDLGGNMRVVSQPASSACLWIALALPCILPGEPADYL